MKRHALPAEVERTLEEHAFSETRQEVGGLLVGTLEEGGGALVTAALPALSAQAGQTHVTFTHDVWERALAELDRDHPGKRIVGWYHTHPGFGLFLSEYDRFIHKEFFSDPRMVALVVDPLAGMRGWFQHDGELRLVQEESTTRAALGPSASPAADDPSPRTARVPALLGIPALLLVGAIGGFVFAGSQQDEAMQPSAAPVGQQTPSMQPLPSPPAPATTSEIAELQNLRAELARVTAAQPAAAFRYRVRRGDSMSEIALSVYGDAQRWRWIAAANPRVPTDDLAIGQVLCVPLDVSSADGRPPRCP